MEDPVQAPPLGTAVTVLCCMCGIPIAPNPSNSCAACLASKSDVTRGISTEATLHQCRGCRRWHREGGNWIGCELESRELMALCLKNVSGLRPKGGGAEKVRLVDAGWVWTEPHSMRLKVRLTVQKEVQSGTILQQSFVVTFVVRNQQCVECQAEYRQGSWKSLVQVRQRVDHKRTFLYLEQLILKHGAHRGCLSIETFRDGMDFYFPDKGKAARFMSFLENVVPVKVKTSKKLIGTDDKSNVSNFKYTNLVEICPLCKDDLLYLPKKTANAHGNISRLVLVKNVSDVIHLVDPLSGQTASMNPETFWRDPLRPVVTAARSRLTRYVVLGKEPVATEQNASQKNATRKSRARLAAVQVARETDLGSNDRQSEERSHLGYLLKSGDVCVGYDLTDLQFVEDDAERARSSGRLPDVVVVRKLYGGAAVPMEDGTAEARPTRKFRLRRLQTKEGEEEAAARGRSKKKMAAAMEDEDMDEEEFLREVDADREMRGNMNLYKPEEGKKKDAEMAEGDEDDEDEDDDQKVKLDELLDGLALDAGPDEADTTRPDGIDEDNAWGMPSAFEGVRAKIEGISYTGKEEARRLGEKESAAPVSGGTFGKEYKFS